ncbi:MAG: AsmA family protein [Gammaproteobacteria bacterium]|nr:AsmA family protein [Gammaproteobacteria bacterium]MBU1416081.1 AsmA family protein [Gammaproteobacteria bacterium]
MKTIKLVGIVLGILAILVIGAIAVLLAMFDSERVKTELADAVQEKTERTLKIDGDLGLFFWPSVGVEVGKVSLSEFRSPDEFAAIDGARVSVAVLPLLSQKIVVEAVELDGARATLIKRKDGTLNIADLTGKKADAPEAAEKAAAPGKPMQIDVASVKITNASLVWRDEQSGETSTLSGLDFATGHIAGDTGTQAWAIDDLALALAGKRGDDSVALKLAIPKLSLAGDAARTLAIDKIDGSIDLASPKMPMKTLRLPISGQLHAELEKQSAKGALSTSFDESGIALKFDVAKFSPLDLGFDLDIDNLNVDKYLPPAKPGEKEPAADGKKEGDARIDLSALKGLNVHGNARIGQLQVNNLKATNIKLRIDARKGKLEIAPHSMNLYDGTLSGALSVNANGNAVTLQENLTGVRINPLLKDLADQDLIEGQGDVRLDLATHGDTVAAMKGALGGAASLALRDGAIKGINLAQKFREMKALLSARQDTVQQAKATDKTDFSELTASFRIADGVARNDDLSMKSPFLRLSGAGDIDVSRSAIDYLAKASVVSTSGGQGAKDLEHLKGVTVPVRVTGPFDKLSYKIEFAAIADGALKAKVEEKKTEVKQELKEKARKELLKGLLGK